MTDLKIENICCSGRRGKPSNMQDAWKHPLVPGLSFLSLKHSHCCTFSSCGRIFLSPSSSWSGWNSFLGHWLWVRFSCSVCQGCQGQLLDRLWGDLRNKDKHKYKQKRQNQRQKQRERQVNARVAKVSCRINNKVIFETFDQAKGKDKDKEKYKGQNKIRNKEKDKCVPKLSKRATGSTMRWSLKHFIKPKTKTKAKTKIETILMVMAFVCEPQKERCKIFPTRWAPTMTLEVPTSALTRSATEMVLKLDSVQMIYDAYTWYPNINT